jgi:hypothetical protein
MTRIDHRSHLHPTTPEARAICRKEMAEHDAHVEKLTEQLLTAWSWYSRDEMRNKILGTACRLGAISPEQNSGTWGYDDCGQWVCDRSTIVTPQEAVRQILRTNPDFNVHTFNNMHS